MDADEHAEPEKVATAVEGETEAEEAMAGQDSWGWSARRIWMRTSTLREPKKVAAADEHAAEAGEGGGGSRRGHSGGGGLGRRGSSAGIWGFSAAGIWGSRRRRPWQKQALPIWGFSAAVRS